MEYAIVSDTIVVKTQALPAHTTNQQAELIVLTHAHQLGKRQPQKLYTDLSASGLRIMRPQQPVKAHAPPYQVML